MKRLALLKLFAKKGWVLKRQGQNHEIWEKDSQIVAIPRHSDINERLAKDLIRTWDL